MPISDFRKKKLLYVFNVFFDVNQSGTIDRKDFELAIEKICSLRGWSAGSPQYNKTFESMIKIWEGLKQRADANKDGQVSVEEWASMWDEYSKNPENPLEWQTAYLRFMFELEDASGDGSIDVDEFTSVCSCYGLDASECKEAFQKMAQGKKEVNYDQFVALWKQFFITENPSDPGNFIFGKTPQIPATSFSAKPSFKVLKTTTNVFHFYCLHILMFILRYFVKSMCKMSIYPTRIEVISWE